MTRPLLHTLGGLLAAASLLSLPGCGSESGDDDAPAGDPVVEGGWVEDRAGLWTVARDRSAPGIAELSYARGYEPAGDELGVTLHLRGRAQDGVNLLCSGHAAEAFLFDMDGELLHTWSFDYGSIPGAPPLDGPHQDCWRRVRMLPDGGLLAMYGGRGLVRLDRDSNLLWHFDERAHHDLELLADGGVLTLTRAERLVPGVNPDRAVIDDFVVELSPDGEVRSRTSVLDALLDSTEGARALRGRGLEGDVLHTNSLRLLGDAHPGAPAAFRPGAWLLCARDMDLVFVLDPRSRRVVWSRTGPWSAPHDPRLVGEDRVLLFDNLGASSPDAPASRLVEFSPSTGEVHWEWRAEPSSAFFSRFCGAAVRLENGNTLVSETGAGRAFELDPDGQVVWSFSSPHRAGPNDRLVAALFELERLPASAAAWLED